MLRRSAMLVSVCLLSAVLCGVALGAVGPSSEPSASASMSAGVAAAPSCGGRYHQFIFGHQGILILKRHRVSCSVARTLAHSLVDRHVSRRGYRCTRDLRIHAGGGGERCTMGNRSIVFGFE